MTVWIVLSAQAHLLWVAALHRHEAFYGSAGDLTMRDASVRGLSLRALPPRPARSDDRPLCTACQIARHSAFRPAAGIVADIPVDSDLLGFQSPPSYRAAFSPGRVYGRAPPLT